MEKIKVIHLMHFSQSIKDKKYKHLMYYNFHHKTAFELNKYLDSEYYEIECWRPEKSLKKTKSISINEIQHRLFPSSITPYYAKEISMPLIRALKREVKRFDGRVILHIHEYHSWHGLLIPLMFNKLILIGQHGGAVGPLRYLSRKWWATLFLPLLLAEYFMEKVALPKYDKLYSLNNYETNYLKTIVPTQKISNQTMGVNFKIFTGVSKKSSRKHLKLKENEFIILFIGRLVRNKGVFELVKAFKKFHSKHKNSRLLIIGDGPYKDELETRTEGFPVEMPGWKDHDTEIKHYLAAADCYAHVSKSEGASVAIMEAMYMNLPIIATPAGNAPQVIKENKTGILVRHDNIEDIHNALLKIYKNPGKHNKESHKLAKEMFDWESIAKKTIKDYETLSKKYGFRDGGKK